MKTFIIKVIIWSILLITPILICFYIYGISPNISNNQSINHKLYISSQVVKSPLQVVAIGSSITLNNLYAPTIVTELDSSFYNFACSGLNISSVQFMAEFYMKRYNYKTLIIASQIEDFNPEQAFTFPTEREFNMMYNQHYYLLSLFSPFKSLMPFTSINTDSTNLACQKYDAWGGVHLYIDKTNVEKGRWDATYKIHNKENSYQSLERICQLSQKNNISLIFAIPPYKKGFITEDEAIVDYQKHIDRCRYILNSYKYQLYDFSEDSHFDESHFADIIHLNEKGAILFTKLLCDQLNRKI